MEATQRPSDRTVESLGKVIYETSPNVSNLIAGVIIALLLLGGGPTLSGYMLRQMYFGGVHRPWETSDWLGAWALVVLGVALAVGGVFLLAWVKSMLGFKLRVCREGFYYTRRGADLVFAWDEIAQVRETILHEKLPLVKGAARQLTPKHTSRFYAVVRCDGKEFRFDQNILPRTSLLAGPLSSAAKDHGFDWETTEETG